MQPSKYVFFNGEGVIRTADTLNDEQVEKLVEFFDETIEKTRPHCERAKHFTGRHEVAIELKGSYFKIDMRSDLTPTRLPRFEVNEFRPITIDEYIDLNIEIRNKIKK